jgi:hypothetical protein
MSVLTASSETRADCEQRLQNVLRNQDELQRACAQ